MTDNVLVNGATRTRVRSQRTWIWTLKKDTIFINATKGMTLKRAGWKKMIQLADPDNLG